MIGKTATLLTPYKGYSRIEIVDFDSASFRYVAKIIDSGKIILVFADEFILD